MGGSCLHYTTPLRSRRLGPVCLYPGVEGGNGGPGCSPQSCCRRRTRILRPGWQGSAVRNCSHGRSANAKCLVRFSRRPVSLYGPPVSPQAQALPAHPAVCRRRGQGRWGPGPQPAALPSKRQGLPDRHGPVPEDCQEAGQLL
ncbi:hypothetical protein DPEC_G00174030 [Dallia pectoralis]|uniref:Uncharacterized protein n=1 Tax=Dallia pectoralis TaxID=75939 RepID=A0ACC2GEF3_DALPE|nr:hypothetical protein DPEC_G00174030 [Dallia pectoralis]